MLRHDCVQSRPHRGSNLGQRLHRPVTCLQLPAVTTTSGPASCSSSLTAADLHSFRMSSRGGRGGSRGGRGRKEAPRKKLSRSRSNSPESGVSSVTIEETFSVTKNPKKPSTSKKSCREEKKGIYLFISVYFIFYGVFIQH